MFSFAWPVHAEATADEAREHYRKGTAAYNLGKYAEAAQEYELSYRATLDPALLFNIAQAYRLAGDRKKALTAYKSYLRSAPEGDKRDLAEARVKEIEAALNYDDPFAEGQSGPRATSTARETSESRPKRAPLALLAEPSPLPTASPPAPFVVTATAAAPNPATPPIYKRWPFWAAVGTAAIIGVVVVVAASGSSAPAAPQTTYGIMRF